MEFYDNLRISWTSRFKIYKDLYSCPPDLWHVAGPSCTVLSIIGQAYHLCYTLYKYLCICVALNYH